MSILIEGVKVSEGCLGCMFKGIGTTRMTQCYIVAGWVEYKNDGYGIPDACPLHDVAEKYGTVYREALLEAVKELPATLDAETKQRCIEAAKNLFNEE